MEVRTAELPRVLLLSKDSGYFWSAWKSLSSEALLRFFYGVRPTLMVQLNSDFARGISMREAELTPKCGLGQRQSAALSTFLVGLLLN